MANDKVRRGAALLVVEDPPLSSAPQTAPRMPPIHQRPQSVTVKTWAASKKWDQVAPFAAAMDKAGITRNSSEQWDNLFAAFNNQPVG